MGISSASVLPAGTKQERVRNNMGLFPSANDFRKAGPGVEKDAPRKTGVGRFFELVGRDMSGMFLANLLTCLGFLPVICLVYVGFLMNNLTVMVLSAMVGGILAGPALAGMYDTVLRALRDEAGYWWTTYRKAFKRNFKSAILPGIVYCTVVTIQIFLVYFCFNMLYHGTNVGLPMWVATVLNLVLLHMLFNIIGSVVPMLLPDTIAAQSALGLFWMAMLVIGMILLVRGRKQQVWLHGPCAPSLKAVLQNAGMFLLIVACFVQTVFNYL